VTASSAGRLRRATLGAALAATPLLALAPAGARPAASASACSGAAGWIPAPRR